MKARKPYGGPICGARKKDGTHCRKAPMANGKCRLHGGATPKGVDHANTKTGQYSKDLPARLASRYERAMEDDRLLDIKRDVALADAALWDAVSGIGESVPGESWAALRVLADAADRQRQARDTVGLLATIDGIIRRVREGADAWESWRKIASMQEHKAKLVERQHKFLLTENAMLSVEQVMTLIAFITSTINATVSNPAERTRIADAIDRAVLTGHRGGTA